MIVISFKMISQSGSAKKGSDPRTPTDSKESASGPLVALSLNWSMRAFPLPPPAALKHNRKHLYGVYNHPPPFQLLIHSQQLLQIHHHSYIAWLRSIMREVISLNGMLCPATRRDRLLYPFFHQMLIHFHSRPGWLPNCKLLLGGELLIAFVLNQ